MALNIIEVENLEYAFDENVVLSGVSFAVRAGEVVVIIGPNGSGKTTLIKNILGIYKPTGGSVRVQGKSPHTVAKIFGYVPQRFDFDRQIPITVGEFMNLENCPDAEHACQDHRGALRAVGLGEVFAGRKLGELSGGQFQRVMIARALMHEKQILVFDEPATGIDLAGEKTVYELIARLNAERGITCLLISHELSVVHRFADRVICLNREMVCSGHPEEVINRETLRKLYGGNAGLYHTHH